MVYPNLKSVDPDLLKKKTNDDKIRELKSKTEKHDNEKFSKSLKMRMVIIRTSLNE